MWEFMSAKPNVFVDSYKEGIKRVRESKGKYAFLIGIAIAIQTFIITINSIISQQNRHKMITLMNASPAIP